MERHCKNCSEMIYAGKNFCSSCGAKWLENRISMKQVTQDFSDLYLGIDTKFVRTFMDLFKKPEAVITGYMNGRRVNYMDAMRYLLLALFVTGIYTFVLKNTGSFENILTSQEAAYEQMNYSAEQLAMTKKINEEFGKYFFDFQGFFLLLTIPFLALAARITFWGKKYFNFTEQMLFYMYTYGHSVIVTTPFTILIILIFPNAVLYLGFVSFPLMYLYNMYCYKRCFKLHNRTIILKTLISFFVILGLFIAVIAVAGIIGIMVGILLKATSVI
jgi:RNA polymerase subunit RPABC4/transcription elongation factor Spt4